MLFLVWRTLAGKSLMKFWCTMSHPSLDIKLTADLDYEKIFTSFLKIDSDNKDEGKSSQFSQTVTSVWMHLNKERWRHY